MRPSAEQVLANSVKYCECGCGKPTKPIDRRSKKYGYEAGDYQRFVVGHANKNSTQIEDVLARFWLNTKELDGGCIEWAGALQGGGYGAFKAFGRQIPAHKFIYELTVAPIPRGMFMDHLCRNRACVNVKHLRVVTPRQNTLENSESVYARNAAKTHCPQGHEYTPENTTITYFNNGPHRNCKTCRRISWKKDNGRRSKRRSPDDPRYVEYRAKEVTA